MAATGRSQRRRATRSSRPWQAPAEASHCHSYTTVFTRRFAPPEWSPLRLGLCRVAREAGRHLRRAAFRFAVAQAALPASCAPNARSRRPYQPIRRSTAKDSSHKQFSSNLHWQELGGGGAASSPAHQWPRTPIAGNIFPHPRSNSVLTLSPLGRWLPPRPPRHATDD